MWSLAKMVNLFEYCQKSFEADRIHNIIINLKLQTNWCRATKNISVVSWTVSFKETNAHIQYRIYSPEYKTISYFQRTMTFRVITCTLRSPL